MAPPEEFEKLNEFIHKIPPSTDMFLPLMQSNDVFILSAILKGLIKRIIWILPTWQNFTRPMKLESYVGWTKLDENKKTYCSCQSFVFKKYVSNFTCIYLNRELKNEKFSNSNIDNTEVQIPDAMCHQLKAFSAILLSEEKFIKQANLEFINNLFVDIDEDFFGVESGVQAIINQGLTLEVHNLLNEQIKMIICPVSISDEQYADQALRSMFKKVLSMKINGDKNEIVLSAITQVLTQLASRFSCEEITEPIRTEMLLSNFGLVVYQKSYEELNVMGNIKYCLDKSPGLKLRPNFGLCSGNIFPGDPINPIHVASHQEIVQVGESLTSILKKINSKGRIQFVSIARSLRDGYTPRHQQREIEKTVLKSLEETAQVFNKKIKVKYDKHLVFGKEGWVV